MRCDRHDDLGPAMLRFIISFSIGSGENVGIRDRFAIDRRKRRVAETREIRRDFEDMRIQARYARWSQCQVSGCVRHDREVYTISE